MDDPAQAIEDAFNGIKDYASKTFESVKTIITGIFDLIDAKKAEAEAKARHEEAVKQREEVANEKGLVLRTSDDGMTTWWEVADEAKYLEAYGGRDALGLLAKKEEKVEVGGTITVEGVDPNGNNVETYDYIIDHTTGMMRRQARMVG